MDVIKGGWWRSWHGAPTDPKWLLIGRKVDVLPGIVSAIAWALLDHASQQQVRGDVATFDIETYASFSGFEEEVIEAVIGAFTDKGVITEGVLTAWEKRQRKREDDSAGRTQAWRDRKREAEQNAVTHGDDASLPVTQCDAPNPDIPAVLHTSHVVGDAAVTPVTRCDAREEKIEREDREDRERKKDSRSIAVATRPDEGAFDRFKDAYPKRDGSNPWKPARDKFLKHVKNGIDPEEMIGGAERYARSMRARNQERTSYVAQAQTWLTQQRWTDYPAGETETMPENYYGASNGRIQANSPILASPDEIADRLNELRRPAPREDDLCSTESEAPLWPVHQGGGE